MNHKKLYLINRSRPLEHRVSVSHVESLVSTARMRGNAVALLATIHEEIAPQIAAMRQAQEIIDRVGSVSGMFENLQVPTAGYLTEPGGFEKYNPEVNYYKMATGNDSDLANENNTFAKLYKSASQKASHDTSNVANGVWQSETNI
jgi:hypothetical protein